MPQENQSRSPFSAETLISMQITIQGCPSDLSIYTVKDLKKSSPLSVQPLCNYLSQYQANSLERLLATSLNGVKTAGLFCFFGREL